MKAGWWLGIAVVAWLHAASAAEPDPTDWLLVRERNGVVLHERSRADDPLVQSRATTTLVGANVFEVLAVLQDDPRRTEWMAACIEARSLEIRDRWNRVSYTRLAVWPFAHRDVVVESRVSLAADGRSAEVRLRSVVWPAQPPIAGVIRMPLLRGDFRLVGGDRGTRVAYTLAMRLGGLVPDRLALHSRRTIPLETLENLRKQVPATRAAYASLVRDWQREFSESAANPD